MTTPHAWLQTAHELHARQQAFALVTVLRVVAPTSAKAGDKAVVTADGQIHGWIGGGCAQPAVVKTVRAALADGQARTIRISPAQETHEQQLADVLEFGMACHSGGTLELFIDPVRPLESLTVLGDSPVARALCDLAPRVGFAVHLVAHGAQVSDFPAASRVLASDDEAAMAELPAGGWAVVATQGRRDLQALKAALALRGRRIWFVASSRKGAVLKASLIASGEDATRVNAIVAPAGAAIGPQTPEEIALSVLAAVVAARRTDVNDAAAPAPTSCCGSKKAAQGHAAAFSGAGQGAAAGAAAAADAAEGTAAARAGTASPTPASPTGNTPAQTSPQVAARAASVQTGGVAGRATGEAAGRAGGAAACASRATATAPASASASASAGGAAADAASGGASSVDSATAAGAAACKDGASAHRPAAAALTPKSSCCGG